MNRGYEDRVFHQYCNQLIKPKATTESKESQIAMIETKTNQIVVTEPKASQIAVIEPKYYVFKWTHITPCFDHTGLQIEIPEYSIKRGRGILKTTRDISVDQMKYINQLIREQVCDYNGYHYGIFAKERDERTVVKIGNLYLRKITSQRRLKNFSIKVDLLE